MVLFIVSGAFLLGIIFQEFEFTLLGAFLGFLLARLNQLSNQLTDLVIRLKTRPQMTAIVKNTSQESLSKKSEDSGSSRDLNPNKSIEKLPKAAFDTYSGVRLAKESEQKSTTTERKIDIQNSQLSDSVSVSHQQQQSTKKNTHVKPDIATKVISLVTNYFTQGNIVVRVGAVILFFGVAFLLKYAVDNSNIPMEFRLMGVAVGGLALLVSGWRLKDKQQGYGLILQGTAVGILYLTLFVAFRLYDMLPASLAFGLLILFSGFAMALAVLQDSRSLAVLSVTGGFLAPILVSTGSGNHVGLFGYYAVLNIGIFAVAWFKSWRLLNLIGFAFTFIIGSAWGVTKYQSQDFITTEPFLILFFGLYSAIALIFAIKQKPSLKGYLDASLVFGLPLICFALQAAMVQDFEFGLAWSAFALGGFYITSAYFILKGKNENLKVIAEAYLALGIIFTSLVIPFALDGEWTAAAWAIEGAGLIWIGLKQSRWFAKYFGTLVQFVGGLIFLRDIVFDTGGRSLFDSEMLGIIFITVAALFSSLQIWQKKASLKSFEAMTHIIFFIWGLSWWYLGGVMEIIRHLSLAQENNTLIIFITASGLLSYILEKKYQWTSMVQVMWVTFLSLVLISFKQLISDSHLFSSWSGLVWSLAIGSFYWVLHNREHREKKVDHSLSSCLPAANNALHFVAFIGLVAISLLELNWIVSFFDLEHSAWGIATFGLLAVLWLLLLNQSNRWPICRYEKVYSVTGLSLIMLAAISWSISINFVNSGQADPLSYLPIINPLDIVQGLLLVFMVKSANVLKQKGFGLTLSGIKLAALVFIFIWLNVILLRSIHAWFNIAYEIDDLYRSFLVQTSISIFWTILGLSGTVYASRTASRKIWLVASGLIGIVVLKLFVIDLDNSSSIERIVSFVVVGLLLLIVGYFSPLPTKENDELPADTNKASENKNDNVGKGNKS